MLAEGVEPSAAGGPGSQKWGPDTREEGSGVALDPSPSSPDPDSAGPGPRTPTVAPPSALPAGELADDGDEIQNAFAEFEWVWALVAARLERFTGLVTEDQRDQMQRMIVAAMLDDARVRQLLKAALRQRSLQRRRRGPVTTPV